MAHKIKPLIVDLVSRIPANKVMNFGEIARLIHSNPRSVGWVMTKLTDEERKKLPWHRVVSKEGYLASKKINYRSRDQLQKLSEEGYFLNGNRVDIQYHRWVPDLDHQPEPLF